ncbi:PAT complex subunit CCDC47 [Microdochium nivale]|nr:PAT complex subunit CCDC47 [Microdochium nivale]
MADFLKNVFGGAKPADTPAVKPDSDFEDFAASPASPSPVPFEAAGTLAAQPTDRPYSAWYNIHERHSLSEFRNEGLIIVIIAIIFTLHAIGSRRNKAKARAWAKANGALLSNEFSQVGFVSGIDAEKQSDKVLKQKSLSEYSSYATGRSNVAFVDFTIELVKRFNPIMTLAENISSFFIDSIPTSEDVFEATLYPFDGREDKLVPGIPGAVELRSKDSKSSYDGFVWAVVNKDKMQKLRDDRYDVSITFTKDNAKLPQWTTVMSESAEITTALLTDELAAAITQAGELFDCLVISDQPTDKPKTIDETTPRKRMLLRYRLPSSDNYDELLPLLACFIRMSDHLAATAHFRPEVMRKIKSVRDENVRQIQKVLDEEKAEERALERDKTKKAKRDAELAGLDAKAQKKYLDKEREKELRKANKKQTMRA